MIVNSELDNRHLALWNAEFVPWPEEILVDEKTAVMTRRAFEKLPDYSCSLPSGTYLGKRWRTHFRDGWFMREFIDCDIPGEIGIRNRRIEIVEEVPS